MPFNSERFRTITLNRYLLLDSYSFLQAPLAELVKDLSQNCKFDILAQVGLYKSGEEEKRQLLLRKGVFPYEAAVSLQAVREMTEIPPIEQFYSSLTDSSISKEDHEHAKTVFSIFSCSTLEDYLILYVLLDTALLAEVLLQFRETVQEEFNLDCW
jgi:hypothetical protein